MLRLSTVMAEIRLHIQHPNVDNDKPVKIQRNAEKNLTKVAEYNQKELTIWKDLYNKLNALIDTAVVDPAKTESKETVKKLGTFFKPMALTLEIQLNQALREAFMASAKLALEYHNIPGISYSKRGTNHGTMITDLAFVNEERFKSDIMTGKGSSFHRRLFQYQKPENVVFDIADVCQYQASRSKEMKPVGEYKVHRKA